MWKSKITGISAALTDPKTLLKRGKVDGHECLLVLNRTNGEVIGDIKACVITIQDFLSLALTIRITYSNFVQDAMK